MPAASASRTVVVLPGLASWMKATHPSAPKCDHLGVAAVPGGPAVAVPVRRVRLDLVGGCAGGVGGADRVGSPRAGAMDQEDTLGMAAQDDREGLLDGGGSSQVRLPGLGDGRAAASRGHASAGVRLSPTAAVPLGG
jgi:hypothetical protein